MSSYGTSSNNIDLTNTRSGSSAKRRKTSQGAGSVSDYADLGAERRQLQLSRPSLLQGGEVLAGIGSYDMSSSADTHKHVSNAEATSSSKRTSPLHAQHIFTEVDELAAPSNIPSKSPDALLLHKRYAAEHPPGAEPNEPVAVDDLVQSTLAHDAASHDRNIYVQQQRVANRTIAIDKDNAASSPPLGQRSSMRNAMQRSHAQGITQADAQKLGPFRRVSTQTKAATVPVRAQNIVRRRSSAVASSSDELTSPNKPSAMSRPKTQQARAQPGSSRFFALRQIHGKIVSIVDADKQDIGLSFDSAQKCYFLNVQSTETPSPTPFRVGSGEHICLKEGNMSKIRYTAPSDPCLKVVCTGLVDSNNYQYTIFEFASQEAFDGFYGSVGQLRGVNRFLESNERMEKLFDTLLRDLAKCQKQEAVYPTTDESRQRLLQAAANDTSSARIDPQHILTNCSHVAAKDRMRTSTIQTKLQRSSPHIDITNDEILGSQKLPGPLHDSLRSSARTRKQSNRVLEIVKSPSPEPVKWSKVNHVDRSGFPVTYPKTGYKRSTVNFDDISRLDEGEFLNDNVMGLCFRKLEHEYDAQQKSVYFFNSFFYTALTTKAGRKTFNYDAVKRWTKNINLFEYDYVVVPINANLHWFVAIICNLPNMSSAGTAKEKSVSVVDESVVEDSVIGDELTAQTPDAAEVSDELDVDVTRPSSGKSSPTRSLGHMTLAAHQQPPVTELEPQHDRTIDDSEPERCRRAEDEEETRVEQEAMRKFRQPAGIKGVKKKYTAPVKKLDSTIPIVITLDSLGHNHPGEIKMLKSYIVQEGTGRLPADIDTKSIVGMTAKGIPEQSNFCDCGVYAIGYVEAFLKSPRDFVEKLCNKENIKDTMFRDFDPSRKRAEIREQILYLAKNNVDDDEK